jgi:hypothetical protein
MMYNGDDRPARQAAHRREGCDEEAMHAGGVGGTVTIEYSQIKAEEEPKKDSSLLVKLPKRSTRKLSSVYSFVNMYHCT